ncbi:MULTISPECIES: hypothetical protein [Arthrobacter]|uniref:DUF1648 domain-containing protein n=2 Tax=Arthrobacter TaxID=1663 RepID=A0ABU9KM98_9MICC|nr:hypothetical protein [Arthrobacter sp. YJM1]MDP5226738.1 hypothetical protein [Arthrobacter sp. YJM1]
MTDAAVEPRVPFSRLMSAALKTLAMGLLLTAPLTLCAMVTSQVLADEFFRTGPAETVAAGVRALMGIFTLLLPPASLLFFIAAGLARRPDRARSKASLASTADDAAADHSAAADDAAADRPHASAGPGRPTERRAGIRMSGRVAMSGVVVACLGGLLTVAGLIIRKPGRGAAAQTLTFSPGKEASLHGQFVWGLSLSALGLCIVLAALTVMSVLAARRLRRWTREDAAAEAPGITDREAASASKVVSRIPLMVMVLWQCLGAVAVACALAAGDGGDSVPPGLVIAVWGTGTVAVMVLAGFQEARSAPLRQRISSGS